VLYYNRPIALLKIIIAIRITIASYAKDYYLPYLKLLLIIIALIIIITSSI
jgi:hypothetical protein